MNQAVRRAFKYRFYPTSDQAAQLSRTFGCIRLVYNLALNRRNETWLTHRRTTTYEETSRWLTEWKKTEAYSFLNDVSSVPLQQSLRHLQLAFRRFFSGTSGYPRFKSKHRSRASAEFTRSAFRWCDGRLTLAKMGEPLDIVWSRPLPDGAEPSSVTVSRDKIGRWHVSILVEDPGVQPLPPSPTVAAIDLGLLALVTFSDGRKVLNPRHGRAALRKLAHGHRQLARKVRGSANREKARLRVAKIYARIVDRRRDHLHKLSTRIVRENQTVVLESLPVRAMLKNHRLASAIQDAAWSQLKAMLEYKARWYGRTLVKVDRWSPTSKRCSVCGTVRESLPLSLRQWKCSCGAAHDRDVNAARNILAAGLAER